MGDASFTSLTTARLVIRRFTLDDVAVFAGYRSDPDVARYQSWSAPYPVESARPFIESLAAANPDEPGGWFQFALALRSDPSSLIGDLALGTIDAGRQAEIGFTLAPAHQGAGYATEAVEALLDYLFTTRGKYRVEAGCDDRNRSSARLLQRVRVPPRGPPRRVVLGRHRVDRRPALRFAAPRVVAARYERNSGMTSLAISSMVCITFSCAISYGLTRHSSRSTPASS